jgi:cytochrome P450
VTRTEAPSTPDGQPGTGPAPAVLPAAQALRVVGTVLVPAVAQGVVLRRPRVVGLAARLHADRRGVAALDRLRRRYGEAPLLLRLPGRRLVLLLDGRQVRRVLDGSPEPYRLDNHEKHAALRQFQPHGVLISRGPVRAERRALNERVLDAARPTHRLAGAVTAAVAQEAAALHDAAARGGGRLDWPTFTTGFTRLVRRVVLGDAAARDARTTELLNRLRAAANWSALRPPRTRLRDELSRRIAGYVERAEPGSLACLVAQETAAGAGPAVDPAGQVPHWLFAFDAAGIAAFRAMALLATHPAQAAGARAGMDDPRLGYLRACVLESLRLWPTTLLVLRDSTAPTDWGGAVVPAGTGFAAPVTFLHRDPRLPYADRFAPEIWLDGTAEDTWSLIPFSRGPGACPGRNLVLLVTSELLAALHRERGFRLVSRPELCPDRPLPHTLNHATVRLSLAPPR